MENQKFKELKEDLEYKNINNLFSLSKEELEKIFSQLSLTEIEELLNKLNEVSEND